MTSGADGVPPPVQSELLCFISQKSIGGMTNDDRTKICKANFHKQKFGKTVGLDGIAMEAIVHGGLTLAVHMSVLFNCFLQAQYLPRTFIIKNFCPFMELQPQK